MYYYFFVEYYFVKLFILASLAIELLLKKKENDADGMNAINMQLTGCTLTCSIIETDIL